MGHLDHVMGYINEITRSFEQFYKVCMNYFNGGDLQPAYVGVSGLDKIVNTGEDKIDWNKCLAQDHGKKKGGTHLHKSSNTIYIGGHEIKKNEKPKSMTLTQYIIQKTRLSLKKVRNELKRLQIRE